ncbi:MAG: hypothetical protein OEV08_10635 [Nitrospira sp.]|nr:hypothetical protein [Nitrospira sp.]
MSERFAKLVSIMAALRAQNGCPWDRKQTHESLKPYLLEETYELAYWGQVLLLASCLVRESA